MHIPLGGKAQQTPGALRLGTGWRPRRDAAGGSRLHPRQDAFRPLPRLRLRIPQDGARRQAEPHRRRVAPGVRRPLPHLGDASGDGGARLPPQGEQIGAPAAHIQRRLRCAAEKQRQMGTLPAARLAVGILQPVKLPGVVKGFRLRPDAPQHRHIFVRAAVAGIVFQPVPVLPLLPVVAAGDDVQGNAPVGELIQGSRLARRQRGRHKSGAMGNQIAQPFGMRRRVARHLKPVGRGRRVAGQRQIKPGGLVGAGKIQDVAGVNAGRHLGAGVDAPAEQAQSGAPVGRRLPHHANHSDDGNAVRAVHAGAAHAGNGTRAAGILPGELLHSQAVS